MATDSNNTAAMDQALWDQEIAHARRLYAVFWGPQTDEAVHPTQSRTKEHAATTMGEATTTDTNTVRIAQEALFQALMDQAAMDQALRDQETAHARRLDAEFGIPQTGESMQAAFERLTQLINPAGVQVPAFVVGPTAGIVGGLGATEFRRVRPTLGDSLYTAAFQPGVCAKPGCTNATTDVTAAHFSFCPHHTAAVLSPLTGLSAALLSKAPVAVQDSASEMHRLCDDLSTDQLHDLLYQHIAPLAALELAEATDDTAKKFYGDILFAVSSYKETFNPWCDAAKWICKLLISAIKSKERFGIIGSTLGTAFVAVAIGAPLYLMFNENPRLAHAGVYGFIGCGVAGIVALVVTLATGSSVLACLPAIGLAALFCSVLGIGIGYLTWRPDDDKGGNNGNERSDGGGNQ